MGPHSRQAYEKLIQYIVEDLGRKSERGSKFLGNAFQKVPPRFVGKFLDLLVGGTMRVGFSKCPSINLMYWTVYRSISTRSSLDLTILNDKPDADVDVEI